MQRDSPNRMAVEDLAAPERLGLMRYEEKAADAVRQDRAQSLADKSEFSQIVRREHEKGLELALKQLRDGFEGKGQVPVKQGSNMLAMRPLSSEHLVSSQRRERVAWRLAVTVGQPWSW